MASILLSVESEFGSWRLDPSPDVRERWVAEAVRVELLTQWARVTREGYSCYHSRIVSLERSMTCT